MTFIKDLVDEHYADTECVRPELDTLNTQNPAIFSEYFEPAETYRFLDKMEFHVTPVHDSWLDMTDP